MIRFLKWAAIAVVALFALAYFLGDPAPPQRTAALPLHQVKAQAGMVAYDLLARTPGSYAGQLVTFRGKVIQVTQSGRSYVLRIDVNQAKYNIWKDTLYVDYRTSTDTDPRILKDDIVQLWGEFVGIKSYTAVLGQTIQIPHVVARAVEASR